MLGAQAPPYRPLLTLLTALLLFITCSIFSLDVCPIPGVRADIIADSKIQMCVDKGPDEPMGPENVTCAYKLVVAVTVLSGQV